MPTLSPENAALLTYLHGWFRSHPAPLADLTEEMIELATGAELDAIGGQLGRERTWPGQLDDSYRRDLRSVFAGRYADPTAPTLAQDVEALAGFAVHTLKPVEFAQRDAGEIVALDGEGKPPWDETLRALASDGNWAHADDRFHTPVGYVDPELLPGMLRAYFEVLDSTPAQALPPRVAGPELSSVLLECPGCDVDVLCAVKQGRIVGDVFCCSCVDEVTLYAETDLSDTTSGATTPLVPDRPGQWLRYDSDACEDLECTVWPHSDGALVWRWRWPDNGGGGTWDVGLDPELWRGPAPANPVQGYRSLSDEAKALTREIMPTSPKPATLTTRQRDRLDRIRSASLAELEALSRVYDVAVRVRGAQPAQDMALRYALMCAELDSEIDSAPATPAEVAAIATTPGADEIAPAESAHTQATLKALQKATGCDSDLIAQTLALRVWKAVHGIEYPTTTPSLRTAALEAASLLRTARGTSPRGTWEDRALGYRKVADDLQSERDALQRENEQLRAKLADTPEAEHDDDSYLRALAAIYRALTADEDGSGGGWCSIVDVVEAAKACAADWLAVCKLLGFSEAVVKSEVTTEIGWLQRNRAQLVADVLDPAQTVRERKREQLTQSNILSNARSAYVNAVWRGSVSFEGGPDRSEKRAREIVGRCFDLALDAKAGS